MTEQVAKGEGGLQRKGPTHAVCCGDTEPVALCFLLTVNITASIPGPLGHTFTILGDKLKIEPRAADWSQKVVGT